MVTAPLLVAQLESERGPLSEGQAGCVSEAFVALPDADVQLVEVAGLLPEEQSGVDGRAVVASILEACGLE